MNIFSKLPFLSRNEEEDVDTTEADIRKERIKFHRDHVRNGPVSKGLTGKPLFGVQRGSGDVRRESARATKRSMRKTRRKQIRNYFETQRFAATVRGHLQAALVLPYALARPIDRVAQVKSTVWLVQNFGVLTKHEDGTESLSYKPKDVTHALEEALRLYGKAVGLPGLEIPEGYQLAIYDEAA